MKYKKKRPKPIVISKKINFKKSYVLPVPPAPTTRDFPDFPKWPSL